MKIVGLTGFAKSGKSTAAEILKNMGGQEVAFAKHLKDVCSIVFGIERDHFDNQKYKEQTLDYPRIITKEDIFKICQYFEVPMRYVPNAMLKHEGVVMGTPRYVAQYIGTDVLRDIDTDIHIKMAFKLNEDSKATFLVCSDMRFSNELYSVQRQKGLTLGISRKAAVPADLENLHPSEKEIPDLIQKCNKIIHNEGTIEQFQDSVFADVKSFFQQI